MGGIDNHWFIRTVGPGSTEQQLLWLSFLLSGCDHTYSLVLVLIMALKLACLLVVKISACLTSCLQYWIFNRAYTPGFVGVMKKAALDFLKPNLSTQQMVWFRIKLPVLKNAYLFPFSLGISWPYTWKKRLEKWVVTSSVISTFDPAGYRILSLRKRPFSMPLNGQLSLLSVPWGQWAPE